MRRNRTFVAAFCLLLGACTGDPSGSDDDADVNAPDADVNAPDADVNAPDATPSSDPDAGGDPACGDDHVPAAQITGTEGIAIAADGTFYYSQSGAVGRRLPGQDAQDDWVDVPNTSTIYGLAYDDASGMLYVAAVSSKIIFQIDTNDATPTATPLYENASGCNGLVVGPDGAVYYSGSGGNVYRVDLQGQRSTVTTSGVPGANGLFFVSPTKLLVLAYGDADIYELTLSAAMKETGRDVIGHAQGASLDGIARDEQGRWYLGDNGGDRLLRFNADWTGQETLLEDVNAAANVLFGRGALDCKDVYVASGGSGKLGVYHLP